MPWSLDTALAACDNHPQTPDERLMRGVASLHAAALNGRMDEAPALVARATELLRQLAGRGVPCPSQPIAATA